MTELSIVSLGHVHAEDLAALTPHFSRIEQLVLDINARDALARHRAEFHRAVDAASAEWILIVREREQVSAGLAGEISRSIQEARAWGFRISVIPYYAGKPLRLGRSEGEIRLFHKRHYLRFANKGEWEEIAVQGTVVRLPFAFEAVTFESADAHRAYLERTGVPHSILRRTLLFLRDVAATRAHDANTLRYIWTEAGFDKGV
jgi:hypothetical protein